MKRGRAEVSARNLLPFEEVIGVVEEVGEKYLLVRCSRTVKISIDTTELQRRPRKGVRICLLALGDGTVKVRLPASER